MVATPTHLFDKTVDIARNTTGVDSGGSPTDSWSNTDTSVACRIQPLSGSELVKYGRDTSTALYRLYMDPATDIQQGDRVTFGSVVMFVIENTDLQEHDAVLRVLTEVND